LTTIVIIVAPFIMQVADILYQLDLHAILLILLPRINR
jgi:hypothetical protein